MWQIFASSDCAPWRTVQPWAAQLTSVPFSTLGAANCDLPGTAWHRCEQRDVVNSRAPVRMRRHVAAVFCPHIMLWWSRSLQRTWAPGHKSICGRWWLVMNGVHGERHFLYHSLSFVRRKAPCLPQNPNLKVLPPLGSSVILRGLSCSAGASCWSRLSTPEIPYFSVYWSQINMWVALKSPAQARRVDFHCRATIVCFFWPGNYRL